jgi:hypothetical protein
LDESTPTPTLEEFLACCDRECEFLVRDYGFERLSSPKEYNEYSVRFRKMELEVDIYGENWGATASCDLIRGEDHVYLGLLVPASRPVSIASQTHKAGTARSDSHDCLTAEGLRCGLPERRPAPVRGGSLWSGSASHDLALCRKRSGWTGSAKRL